MLIEIKNKTEIYEKIIPKQQNYYKYKNIKLIVHYINKQYFFLNKYYNTKRELIEKWIIPFIDKNKNKKNEFEEKIKSNLSKIKKKNFIDYLPYSIWFSSFIGSALIWWWIWALILIGWFAGMVFWFSYIEKYKNKKN